MNRISFGLFVTALATLLLELSLIRIFDVIWYPNMAYMVITLAMFCFGLAGVYSAIRPFENVANINRVLATLTGLLGCTALCILPALNLLPFDFSVIFTSPLKGIPFFLCMYFSLALPFFFSGLIFTLVFSTYSDKIQKLYFWDLFGAALGCIVIVPLLPPIGPGGILFLICGMGFLASALFSNKSSWSTAALVVAIAISAVPFFRDGYVEFVDHIDKRGVKSAKEAGKVEVSHWDPVSKIDVFDVQGKFGKNKHIAYDGGSQSSFIYPFDGNFQQLRDELPDKTHKHFGGQHVYLSHFLKQDSDQDVLIIGAAAGQELKAALAFGAKSVDAVELVRYVVELGKGKYSEQNGNTFNNPRANIVVGEGRSFLRSTAKKYDIIQIFSNHTSSSIAAGSGAMATTYLQTKEAYQEYFSHLKDDGILHINHHIYPRMITTAALAWKDMGRTDFRKHVVVFQARGGIMDTLPTLLVKMVPWTEEEIARLKTFFVGNIIELAENPFDPKKSFLTDDFYSGNMPDSVLKQMEYRAVASTDDRPYFNFLRKNLKFFSSRPGHFMDFSTAAILNKQMVNNKIPKDIIHLFITGFASLLFAFVFIFVPLLFSKVGRSKWTGKSSTLIYFSCLGCGFIIFELVFIQIFMKLIGYPLYTYSAVVFSLLLAAAVGSYCSGKFNIHSDGRWHIPFLGILLTSILLLIVQQPVFEFFLQKPEIIRIIAAILMIFPIGFFLGMPFPLGILAIQHKPAGAIAWAWAMNGLFTVIGGIMSVLLSIYYGFSLTLGSAMFVYILAWLVFRLLRCGTKDAEAATL